MLTDFLTFNDLILWGEVQAESMFTTPEVLRVSPLLVTGHTEHVITLCCDEHESGTVVAKHVMLEPAHTKSWLVSLLRLLFHHYYYFHYCF